MVQELNVLKCFSCDTFQTQIVKKTKKWECKICGTKQSIKKVYGRGSGKDCRLHTQKLNALRGEKSDSYVWEENDDSGRLQSKQILNNPHSAIIEVKAVSPKESKWAAYLDEDKICDEDENPTTKETCAAELNYCVSSKRKRKRGIYKEDFANDCANKLEAKSILEKDSLFYIPSSKENTKNMKYSKSYNENNSGDENYNFNSGCNIENEEKVDFKVKKQNTQKAKANISLKWAKYLDDDSNEETLSNSQSSRAGSPISVKSVLNNDVSVNSSDSFNESNFEKTEDLLHKYKNNVPNYFVPSSSKCSKNQNDSQIISKGSENALSALPSQRLVENTPEFKMKKHFSVVQPVHALPVFEQYCDVDDSDFELNF